MSQIQNNNLSKYEEDFIKQLNIFRCNPKFILPHLEKFKKSIKDDNIAYREDDVPLKLEEGVEAVNEAIDFVSKLKPLPQIKVDEGLNRAAQDHALDIGTKGLVSHEGSDLSVISDRIERYCEWEDISCENIDFGTRGAINLLISFLVDDGIPSRGHRKNIVNERIKYFGVSMAPHKDYFICTVVVFAGNIRDKNKPYHDLTDVKYNYPDDYNKKQDKSKKVKNQYQLDDEDAPDNTIAVKTVKQTKLYNGRVHRVTKKFYTLSDGSTTIVEVEDI